MFWFGVLGCVCFICLFVCVFVFSWDIDESFELILKNILNVVLCFGRSCLEKWIVGVHYRVNLLSRAMFIL